jgi:aminopeptidase-like protein
MEQWFQDIERVTHSVTLPVLDYALQGSIFRSAASCAVCGTFLAYHTSADNLDFIRPPQLTESLRVCAAIVDLLAHNRCYHNQSPYGAPQLGQRNLYRSTGGDAVGVDTSTRL